MDRELFVLEERRARRQEWRDAHADDTARFETIKRKLPDVLAERVREVERRCPRYVEDVLGRPTADEAAR